MDEAHLRELYGNAQEILARATEYPTFEAWNDDLDWAAIADPTDRESLVWEVGRLTGWAESLDLTVCELLELVDCDPSQPLERKEAR